MSLSIVVKSLEMLFSTTTAARCARSPTALSPWPLASAPNRVLLVGGTLVIAFALAELTERKKELWRVGLSRAFPG